MDLTNKEEIIESEPIEQEGTKYDPCSLRVKGGENPTDPVALSRSILHVLSTHDHVSLFSVGPKAHDISMRAFRLASKEAEGRTNGAVLVCRQAEYEAVVANKKTKGICTRIFGISIKSAL